MSVTLLKTKEDFDDFLMEHCRVAVDFFADWCGPCKMISPKFVELSKEFSSIDFAKVNVDENEETSESQGVSAMPTFKFYINGVKTGELVGANESKLREELEKIK